MLRIMPGAGLYLVSILVLGIYSYDIPRATIELLCPRGLEMSLTDSPGVKYVAVQATVNEPLVWPSLGEFSNASTGSEDGRWKLHLRDISLSAGDTIHYWLQVIYRQASMHTAPLSWRVTDDPCYVGGGCVLSKTQVISKEVTCSGELVFSDEFNDLDLNQWHHDVTAPDSEFQIYVNNRSNSFVREGLLHLRATLATDWIGEETLLHGAINLSNLGCASGSNESCYQQAVGGMIISPTLSARLTTRHSFKFMFGHLEFRARPPRGLWLWPEVTLVASDNVYGSGDHASGVLTPLWGNQRSILALIGDGILTNQYFAANTNLDGFNVYRLIWSPDRIEFSVNEEVIGTFNAGNGGIWRNTNISQQFVQIYQLYGSAIAPFDQMFYISLSLSVGGLTDHHFPDTFAGYRKPWNISIPSARLDFWDSRAEWLPSWQFGGAEFLVDYIRIRAL